MLKREKELAELHKLLKHHSIVGIIGARQVGKTTLARLADPMLALKDLRGLIVIEEIQRYTELFPILRVLVDRPRLKTKFLVLGSASPELLRQSSETLAGRIVYH